MRLRLANSVRWLSPLFLLIAALPAFAQSVHWEPSTGTLAVGQPTALNLVFEECAPKGEPTLPKVDGLLMQLYTQSTGIQNDNGKVSRSVKITYATVLQKKQVIEIPSFEIETDKGQVRVASARFDPGTATVGHSGRSLDSATTAKLTVVPTTVWAGEVFELTTSVAASTSYAPTFQRNFDWNPDPLVTEGWSNPEQIDFNNAGEPYLGIAFRTRGLARNAGTFRLNPANHVVNLSVGVTGFGFFQQRQYGQYSIPSNTPIVEVKSLPTPPAGFTGAVGQFKLNSKVVPANATIGEPITWTIELTGTGNWPDVAGLPSREVSKDFNVVQPQARRTPSEGKLFDVTLSEDVVLVPTKAGSYTLGPINFVYFDPKSGGYKTVSAPRTTVAIIAPEIPKFGISLTGPETTDTPATKTATTGSGNVALAENKPPVPVSPAGIPRDPLEGSASARLPWGARRLATGLVAPFSVVLVIWIALALYRAQRTDPARPRREARKRISATLEKLRTASATERPKLLLQWQRDTAVLWEMTVAAPQPSAFFVNGTRVTDAAETKAGETPPVFAALATEWSILWKDSDRALYGAEQALPTDWLSRAEHGLKAKAVPRFSPARAFRPRNLLPFFAVLALGALVLPAALRAQDPVVSYRGGDFAAAEKIWRETVTENPLDWMARYNLSLAMAQQDRWNEAAAHATVAFVQHPQNAALRWQFALACDKAGFAPAPLEAFLRPNPVVGLVARASSAEWQRLLVAATSAVAFVLVLILFNTYGLRSRLLAWVTVLLLVLSLAGVGFAIFAIRSYGITKDTRTVIAWHAATLRSVPTESDTSQKTTPLPAGTVALIDKTFLGWIRLTFENGQTGWVRKEDVVGLWK